MQIDQDSRTYLRKELSRIVSDHVNGLVTGDFPTIAALERQRGILCGLGIALDVIEGNPATPNGEPPQENEDDSTQD